MSICAAWCRIEGHRFDWQPDAGGTRGHAVIVNGGSEAGRWAGSQRAGQPDARRADAVAEHPPRSWGLAARGAMVEAGAPEFDFHLVDKVEVWADDAARIYAQAVAAQWDPETAIPWNAEFDLPDDVEDAVVQIMTFLIENETAALIIPSRFIAQLHPHFREVMQVLAVQAADEARHIDVFTRRGAAQARPTGPFDDRWTGVAQDAGRRARVRDCVVSPLGARRGNVSFPALVHRAVRTRSGDGCGRTARRAGRSRHVAFGLAHLGQHLRSDAGLRPRLADAIRRRHEALRHTAGLNAEVFDALLLMAAGSWDHADLREGHRRVMQLTRDMDEGRRKRLMRLGFSEPEAEELSALHTRNFM